MAGEVQARNATDYMSELFFTINIFNYCFDNARDFQYFKLKTFILTTDYYSDKW